MEIEIQHMPLTFIMSKADQIVSLDVAEVIYTIVLNSNCPPKWTADS
jgi:hypothetical protein